MSRDIERAERLILKAWVACLAHLSRAYPCLYGLAERRNPLAPGDLSGARED